MRMSTSMSNKKGTITSRTLEKLGFSTFRFRSNSQPTPPTDLQTAGEGNQKEVNSNSDGTQEKERRTSAESAPNPEKLSQTSDSYTSHTEKTSFRKSVLQKLHLGQKPGLEDGSPKKRKEAKSIFYVSDQDVGTDLIVPEKESESAGSMQEKKKKIQPEGTIEYIVKDRETIERIAAHHDTTPSELKKINRLSSWMIFPGQVLYLPDKAYTGTVNQASTAASSQAIDVNNIVASVSPLSSPKDRPAMDVPILKMADKPPPFVPGHVERQTPVSSPTDNMEFEIITPPPQKLSDDEAKQLDQDCYERFIKLRVKHITDGQGVVKGTLLVTPNAVMFDPSVLDPLVKEHGADRYGMIAPMDMIISAAMYHDIAFMKQRGQKQADGSPYPKPTVYHDRACALSDKVNKNTEDVIEEEGGETVINNEPDHNDSLCSCGASEPPLPSISESAEMGDNSQSEADLAVRAGLSERQASDDVFSEGVADLIQLDMGAPPGVDKAGEATPTAGERDSVSGEVFEDSPSPATDSAKPPSDSPPSNVIPDTEPGVETAASADTDKPTDTEGEDRKKTRIGSIVYLPVQEDDQGQVTLEAVEQTQSALSKLSTEEFKKTSKSDSESSEGAKDVVKERTASTSSLGAFSPTPHLNAFVNYATGFFQRSTEDKNTVKDIKDLLPDAKISFDIPMVSAAPSTVTHRGKKQKISRHDNRGGAGHQEVEVESAVSMDEKYDLLHTDYNRFAPRPSIAFVDPPLYLCLRLGKPQNKNVFHNYSIESYGKSKKRSEYWFSIPREKVDQLYAFFVQWTPEIYGDEDDMEPEKRGFVVINEDEELGEELDTFDDHFGPNSSFQKDWEIISKAEAVKRRSIVFDIPIPLPDLIGQSTVLTEEHIAQLNKVLPPRTIGYPWTLIYTTDKHGFSLKTLYRDMNGLDSPILLVVKDTADSVFGALTSCELKISDHFYGTGESFLYTFYPEFKLFPWTGDNNFFLKGNKESLSIGAGNGVFGLWFDGDIYHGRSNQCETYNNDILTTSEDFVVKAFEAWAFVQEV